MLTDGDEWKELRKGAIHTARKTRLHVRREQISLGVLDAVMQSLGRMVFESVHAHPTKKTHASVMCGKYDIYTACNCIGHGAIFELNADFPCHHTMCNVVGTHEHSVILQDPLIVIDPFSGTASTGVAALRRGCYYIGVDKDDTVVVLTALYVVFVCFRAWCQYGIIPHTLVVRRTLRNVGLNSKANPSTAARVTRTTSPPT
jgi:hypothetical protein